MIIIFTTTKTDLLWRWKSNISLTLNNHYCKPLLLSESVNIIPPFLFFSHFFNVMVTALIVDNISNIRKHYIFIHIYVITNNNYRNNYLNTTVIARFFHCFDFIIFVTRKADLLWRWKDKYQYSNTYKHVYTEQLQCTISH